MTDQKSVVAEEPEVETETTATSSPQDEKPTTGAETTETEDVSKAPVLEEADELPASSDNWTEEQRRAFQEQRQEIKRLKTEKEARVKSESAFSAFRAPTPPVGHPGPVRVEDFSDPLTGETNWTAYNQAQEVREQRIVQNANFTAQQTAQDIVDENNARTKYPDVFADSETEQEVADRWFAAKMRGENPSISEVAERVAKRFGKAVSKAEKIGAEKALNEVSEKEQAGLSASGQTSAPAERELSTEEAQTLSDRTRRGDNDAIAARVSKIPWANK